MGHLGGLFEQLDQLGYLKGGCGHRGESAKHLQVHIVELVRLQRVERQYADELLIDVKCTAHARMHVQVHIWREHQAVVGIGPRIIRGEYDWRSCLGNRPETRVVGHLKWAPDDRLIKALEVTSRRAALPRRPP